jgi:hypothetical protein
MFDIEPVNPVKETFKLAVMILEFAKLLNNFRLSINNDP